MKTKFILLILLLFTATFSYAQTSAEIADIAVQGIARDNNNTAKINTTISLTFELYYLDANNFGNKEVIGVAETVSLTTDAFGVFSHIVSPIASNNAIFANQQVYLKISEGSEVISEEKLKHVPYAIAANNGVPTGSIMPFVGGTAPTGWVLCNGQSLTSIIGSGNLIALLGSNNAPNLQAMYLRGAGSQNYGGTNYAGITLKAKQNHTVQMHNHAAGTLGTSNTGAHQHNVPHSIDDSNLGSVLRTAVNRSVAANGAFQSGMPTSSVGNHAHAITGSTANGGTAGETRPVSYGVNYIIKL
jgi:hypothetical protein